MEYKMNLGSWNSVFAVPGDIVDKHLRLAGAAEGHSLDPSPCGRGIYNR